MSVQKKLGRIRPGSKPEGGIGSGANIFSGHWETEKAPQIATSQQRAEGFLRAYKTDARVSQAVDEHLATLSTGTWIVEPGGKSSEDLLASEFVSAVLFGNESQTFGREYWARPVWPQRRYELGFSLLVYGYAVYHKHYKVITDEDGRPWQVPDKFTYIEPATITLWQLSDIDDLELIQRSYTKGDDTHVFNEEILAADLALYTHGLVGANYEGISLVRKMWPAFIRKEFLEKVKMIAGKRLFCPIPGMKVPKDVRPGSEAWIRIEQFLQAMTNPNMDTAYVAVLGDNLPEWIQAGSIESLKAIADWIKDENAEISAVGGNKGMMLGETETGSRSLGNSIGARETLKRNALAEDIVTLENFGIAGLNSLITELVQLNFPTVQIMPYVCFQPAGTEEALKNSSVFADLVAKKVVHVFASDEMRIREQLGFDDTVTVEDIQSMMDKEATMPIAVSGVMPQSGEDTVAVDMPLTSGMQQ